MAYPDAVIYEITGSSMNEVDYDETEHYQTMRTFFDNPKRIIDMLIKKDEE